MCGCGVGGVVVVMLLWCWWFGGGGGGVVVRSNLPTIELPQLTLFNSVLGYTNQLIPM